MEVSVTGDTLIEDLQISTRLQNCLFNKYADLKGIPHDQYYRHYRPENNLGLPPPKVKDFAHLTDAELLRHPNLGRRSLREWNELTAHLRRYYSYPDNDDVPDNEEYLAEVKLLLGITKQIRLIAGNHKATGTLYSKLADLIDNIK